MRGSEALDAARRARRLYPRSQGFQGAYVKGAAAAAAGRPLSSCPYPQTTSGTTWRRAWRLAWVRGYHSVAGEPSEG